MNKVEKLHNTMKKKKNVREEGGSINALGLNPIVGAGRKIIRQCPKCDTITHDARRNTCPECGCVVKRG